MSQDKPRVGIFGRTNAGKSTLFNLLLDRQASIISPVAGTTTDPVRASIELLDYGAVMLIDTAGIDDRSELGEQRIAKTKNIISEVELAVVVIVDQEPDQVEREFLAELSRIEKRHIVVKKPFTDDVFYEIKTALGKKTTSDFFGGRITKGDTVILVCPIDSEAPKGKLIMPQIAAIRAALDLCAKAVVVQPNQLAQALAECRARLVVTDSQAFDRVRALVPQSVELTSFSILLSEQKGDPRAYEKGLQRIGTLKNGDRILTIEHCTHQSSCDDIARVKIPRLLKQNRGLELDFTIISGRDPLPDDLDSFALALQCGGCVASSEAIAARIKECQKMGVEITNYGMLLKLLLC